MKSLAQINKKNLMSSIEVNNTSTARTSELAEFKNQAVSISTSDEFKNKISSKLGDPRQNETKEEYVARCKKLVMDELFEKLKL